MLFGLVFVSVSIQGVSPGWVIDPVSVESVSQGCPFLGFYSLWCPSCDRTLRYNIITTRRYTQAYSTGPEVKCHITAPFTGVITTELVRNDIHFTPLLLCLLTVSKESCKLSSLKGDVSSNYGLSGFILSKCC